MIRDFAHERNRYLNITLMINVKVCSIESDLLIEAYIDTLLEIDTCTIISESFRTD